MQQSINSQLLAERYLFNYAAQRAISFLKAGRRFVHYCSAKAALSVIENEAVWMRNARLMNDFSEIEHGTRCLQAALSSTTGQKLKRLLSNQAPELAAVLDDVAAILFSIKADTYIVCFSEHDRREDCMGRLSMWRGYGGSEDAVALILNSTPFMNGTADISPVAYLTEEQFTSELSAVVSNLPYILSAIPVGTLKGKLRTALTHAVMCTKHPGFAEEREWRLIYRPDPNTPSVIVKDQASPKGFPETIYKIPLRNDEQLGVNGIEVRDLIERIIVGPTDDPTALRERFVTLLGKKGIVDPENRVIASNIPFRRNVVGPSQQT